MIRNFIEEAANVVPSKRQLDWFDVGFYAFIHFGVNTYTDREWGNGEEPEQIFHPTALDCDQWVEAIKAAGMKGMILTAKHHDGFCLWPSKYTEHSVKNSLFHGDVVREAAEACRRGGIKFGFYLSPWDRNSKLYGTDAYNDYFCNQLTELLTEYGDIFCVWFDNACGEGPNGVKQQYDFPRYFELIRKYQPNAVIFNDFGPDIRWCGNEAGSARESEWAVVPTELCRYSKVQTGCGPLAEQGELVLYNTAKSLGNLDVVLYSKGLTFTPAEIDTSIRPGWFWHAEEEPKSLEQLFQIYVNAVGGNCCLNLNIPPNKEGRFDEKDVTRLQELGDMIRACFSKEIPCVLKQRNEKDSYLPEYEIIFEKPISEYNTIVLEEDLTHGQRIESFQILRENTAIGKAFPIYQGRTVGNCKICTLWDVGKGQNPLMFSYERKTVEYLVLRITSSRGPVYLKNVKVY